ncbi:MAG TPA: ribosome small subunit-dependent GTPase A [Gemmatimonadota bacterium]|nr:ribosome small subunit-dependent GTPase A [Gemmatimonadota bacterium]
MSAKSEAHRGRVLRSVGGAYTVEVGGEPWECSLRGRIKLDKSIGRVAVGDVVEVAELADGSRVISGVLPRTNRISRRRAGGRREQVIAANADRLAAVFSITRPEPVFSLLDRFLVLAEANGIPSLVVVNKIDLSGEGEARRDFGVYEEIGYEVIYTSAKTGAAIGALGQCLAGRVTLLVGPSGAGKSSLLNALQPGLGLRVGELSRVLQRGRHTTVAACAHPLDIGGYVVDTPGLGTLQFAEVGDRSLEDCFPEFRPYLERCKFDDCTHVHEPECSLREALARGDIPDRRYESYVKILGERDA